MPHFICKTCGVQFAETAVPPPDCPICLDERQFVGWEGQQWTTLAELRREHRNEIRLLAPHLTGIGTTPRFAIGQRALLVQTPEGNLLWDCISLLDDETIAAVQERGGIRAIAISHPHFYDAMIAWSRAFDAPVYLHAADRQWVMRPDAALKFWDGASKPLWSELSLIHCGGHFPGGTVLHWPQGANGRGALLTGDIIHVVADRRYVSFMRSFPNLIPLSAGKVHAIAAAVAPYAFDRIYGGWWDSVVGQDGKTAVSSSAARYIAALQE